MSLGLIGKKVGMTRIFDEDGVSVPVTVISAGPCSVVAVRDGKNGGKVVQVGYGEQKESKVNKPRAGHFKKAGVAPCRVLKEFAATASEVSDELKAGATLDVEMFVEGEMVNVRAQSKGKGFMGAMRRHGFSGAQKTHGQSDRMRAPGSIGQSSYPSRVLKGMRMAGRTGHDWVTVRNLQVVRILKEDNALLVRGAVPGAGDKHLVIKKNV